MARFSSVIPAASKINTERSAPGMSVIPPFECANLKSMNNNNQLLQTNLMMTWRHLLHAGHPLPSFDEVQFRVHSQNGEDGILLYLFTLLGTTNKKVLEICAGDGQCCNAANLIINHGWEGFLLDGDEDNVKSGKAFFRECPDTRAWPPKFRCEWITRENINEIVQGFNLSGEIDLLSLDIDGNDYWILDALDVVQPRVIIAEYQQGWGPHTAVTQRYQADFDSVKYRRENAGKAYSGASLAALTQLAQRKGLRLVGCERKCFNAIFVRNGLGDDILPAIAPADCFDHVMARYNMAWLPEKVDVDSPFWEYV